MKASMYLHSKETNRANLPVGFQSLTTTTSRFGRKPRHQFEEAEIGNIGAGPQEILTSEALQELAHEGIPDLQDICEDLLRTFYLPGAPYNATQFVPVLSSMPSLDQDELQRLMRNPKTSHVLVENDLLKVVLIHWKPGKISSIHGHPQGGCVFKLLQGSLEELRYTTDVSPKLLSVTRCHAGSIAYIDDNMGFHAVGNPFNTPAISLHAYTPGRNKQDA